MVVGGGRVAERKIASLLECGARVSVISPEATPAIEEQAARGDIELARRAFDARDLDGARLAIAATNNAEVNRAVVAAGETAGVWVNVVDVPELCDFYVPACVKRGDLRIAINTGGACPALAKKLRVALEEQFGPEYADYLEVLARFRHELKRRVPEQKRRAAIEAAFLEAPVLPLLAVGKRAEAERLADDTLARLAAKDEPA